MSSAARLDFRPARLWQRFHHFVQCAGHRINPLVFFQRFEMLIKSFVRGFDQPLVKLLFASAGLVRGHVNDGLAFRIEGERCPPHAVKPQLLHIGVLRAFQRIDARAARRRAECFDDLLSLVVRN